MIGHEQDNEEVQFRVADRRKFNSDGSLREGVVLDPPKPVVAEPKPAKPQADETERSSDGSAATTDTLVGDDDGGAIPGIDDPASFLNFLSTLATNAAAALGAVAHPATGKRTLDLESGKYWLDVLSMLREKTRGNLHAEEHRLLEGLLGDLRMQYVQLVRATEEKLKAQAAAKFSGEDILGKKV